MLTTRSLRRRRLTLALAATAMLLAATAAPAGAASPGVNVTGLGDLAAAKDLGAKTARIFFMYPGGATTSPSSSEFATFDQFVNGYADAGIKPLLVVTGKGGPPSSVLGYASYVGALAQRYGGRVAGFEVWNEQDEAIWWGTTGGDPSLYAALLRATYGQVGGRAPVVFGGLTGNNYAYLEQVYTALGGNSANAFDAVGVHTDTGCSIVGPDSFFRNPDGRISQYSFLGLREIRASMVAHGDAGKKVWMTELGWSTTSHLCDVGVWAGKKAGGVSEAKQAEFLGQAYRCMANYDYVEQALWFTVSDVGADSSLTRYGLVRTDGSHKPAYKAMADVIAGRNPYKGDSCGDFDGPKLTVSPSDGGQFVDVLPIAATASDDGGVGRITLKADGQVIRNFTTGKTREAGFPTTLRGTITWQGAKRLALGPHTLEVAALDANGNTTTRTLKLTKVSSSTLKGVATRFAPLKLGGRGANRTLRVAVNAPTSTAVGFRANHKVDVRFEKLVKGTWRTAHKYTRTAKKPFTLKVKLAKAQWRVRATFRAKAPFKAARTPFVRFTV